MYEQAFILDHNLQSYFITCTTPEIIKYLFILLFEATITIHREDIPIFCTVYKMFEINTKWLSLV